MKKNSAWFEIMTITLLFAMCGICVTADWMANHPIKEAIYKVHFEDQGTEHHWLYIRKKGWVEVTPEVWENARVPTSPLPVETPTK